MVILCACGCGQSIEEYSAWGYRRKFILGHNLSKNKTLLDRIESQIVRIPECGCWIWMGPTKIDGYGRINVNQRNCHAHRISWELYKGPIPQGMCVLHRCDTPSCVNPHHLFLGTKIENNKDRDNKKRTRNQFTKKNTRHPSSHLWDGVLPFLFKVVL